jgi:tight adherence protein B
MAPSVQELVPYILAFIATATLVMGVEIALLRVRSQIVRSKAINRRMEKAETQKSAETLLLELRKERGLDQLGHYRYFSHWLNRLHLQSGYSGGLAKLLLPGILAGTLIVIVTWLATRSIWIPPIVGLLTVLVSPLLVLMRLRAVRRRHFATQLPEALDVIVRSLRAGHPTPVAIGLVGREMPDPIGTEFGMVSDEMTYGLALAETLKNLLERVGLEDLRLLVVAISIQTTTGGNLSEILGNLSRVIRERAGLRARVKALSAEGRMSGIVLSLFPFILFGVITLLSPDYYSAVIDRPIVFYGLSGALLLMFIGDFIMYKMVTFDI